MNDNINKAFAETGNQRPKSFKDDKDLNLYAITFDCTCIMVYANDKMDALQIFREEDMGFEVFLRGEEPFIRWSDDCDEPIQITRIRKQRGVVSVESH